jgi:AcrR family transcriptional regulator
MPITSVDHDERRRRIAEAAVGVIAREGLEAATIRRIAAELGGPTKAVTHYFAEKQQLLVWAYRSLAEQGQQAVKAVIAREPGDIVDALVAMAPVNDEQALLWRVYIAFWDRAARDPEIAELQRLQIDLSIQRIAQLVRAWGGEREDLDSVSLRLNAVVQGVSIQALMDQERWPAERIRGVLADEVVALLGRSAASG